MFDPSSLSPLDPRFVEWVTKYNQSRAASRFYAEIAAHPETATDKWLLEYQCLLSAFHAALWPVEGSSLEIGRTFKANTDSFKESLPEQRNAIARLRGPLSRNGPESHAAAWAIRKLSESGLVFTNKTGKPLPYSEMLSGLLAEYEAQLQEYEKQLAGHNNGKARELSYMCIMWSEARDIPERATELETALCFDVLCMLGRYNAGESLYRNSSPTPPSNPAYSRAAKITLLLGGSIPTDSDTRRLADRIRQFMKRNPGIRSHRWPTM